MLAGTAIFGRPVLPEVISVKAGLSGPGLGDLEGYQSSLWMDAGAFWAYSNARRIDFDARMDALKERSGDSELVVVHTTDAHLVANANIARCYGPGVDGGMRTALTFFHRPEGWSTLGTRSRTA